MKQTPGNLTTDEKNDKDTEWEENKESASLFLEKVTVCECRLLIAGHCWSLLLNLDLRLRRNKGPAETLSLDATLSSLLISSQAAIFTPKFLSLPLIILLGFGPISPALSWKLESGMRTRGLSLSLNSAVYSLHDLGLGSLIRKRGVVYLSRGASMMMT